jgi:hypothetical protein
MAGCQAWRMSESMTGKVTIHGIIHHFWNLLAAKKHHSINTLCKVHVFSCILSSFQTHPTKEKKKKKKSKKTFNTWGSTKPHGSGLRRAG